MAGHGVYSIFVFHGYRQFGIVVIFNNVAVSLFGPAQIFMALRYAGGNAAGIAIEGSYVKNRSFCTRKFGGFDADGSHF
jgi:hypothetical protein